MNKEHAARPGDVNLTHLRAFYAVASDRSVSAAARRLGISQPTLSKQLKSLEERHRIKLIDRDRTPLSLTAAGEAVFEKTRTLFDVTQEISALLGQDDKAQIAGVIRLGTGSPKYAADFIAAFSQAGPNCLFKVSIAAAQETLGRLMNGEIDMAVVGEPTIHSEFVYIPLYVHRLVAVAPAGWTRNKKKAVAIEDLMKDTLLIREPTSRTRSVMFRLMEAYGVTPTRTMEIPTSAMLREAVASGLGVTMMWLRDCPPDKRIEILPLKASPDLVRAQGYLVIPRTQSHTPVMRRAIEVAEAFFTRHSGSALAKPEIAPR
jgi:DNA-binding transcriptional LysR family regulator